MSFKALSVVAFGGIRMRRHRLLVLAVPILLLTSLFGSPPVGAVGTLPPGTQSDDGYANSGNNRVSNVFATTQGISCYRPEVPYPGNLGPVVGDGYSGMSPCNDTATTSEDTGLSPYPTQLGSNPGFSAAGPMLFKNHSESDIRVDPTDPKHLIGSSKWAVSAEGYNHLLGFYESFDGGVHWPVQGHIPGYEGWTDNTDPVGAFDSFGNYYSLVLPYQFFYNSDGTHNFSINPNEEPNPSLPAEVIAIAIRPKGAATADDWSTNRQGAMDIIASYPARGREPDKQWITINTNRASHHFNRIYAMWTIFDGITAHPLVSYADALIGGKHTPWSTPQSLPTAGNNPQGVTYLLPNVDGNGTVYTTLTSFEPKTMLTSILLDRSTDGGVTWESVSTVVADVTGPPAMYPNTNFRDGIENTFAVGPKLANGRYPLYVAWEDYSTGYGNVKLRASYDGGVTWSTPIRVNDNEHPNIDAFQPNLTVAANGTVSVAFYDRRLACPAQDDTTEAANAGLALDTINPRYSGSLPPYGAINYCVNSTVQFYGATLAPKGNNIRTSLHTWDPQLNSMKSSGINRTRGFIGDYYGNTTGVSIDPTTGVTSYINYTTSVSTYNDNNTNPSHFQQQVVAKLAVP
ncbi:MAG: hypothetical protein PVS3B2_07690 [Candidatus Dormibacteraceae bacterium]